MLCLTAIQLYKQSYNEVAKVQPTSETVNAVLYCSQSFHHPCKKEDPIINTVTSPIAAL